MATVPDINPTRATPAWRQKLAAFWRWWTGELSAAMPERLAALRGGARVPVVALEDEELVLVEPRVAAGPDSRVALQTLDPGRRRPAALALLERAGESRGRARLCLGAHEALVRRTTLPAAMGARGKSRPATPMKARTRSRRTAWCSSSHRR